MAGIVFLIDTLAFVVVVLWAFGAEGGLRERTRGLLDMVGDAIASVPSGPRWASSRTVKLAPGGKAVAAWRRRMHGAEGALDRARRPSRPARGGPGG